MTLLDTIYLHVTKACNLKCIYCYFSAGKPMESELTSNEMVSVIKDIPLLSPRRVVITGGEPLLRSDIFDLAGLFDRIGFEGNLCITTNGTLINETNVDALVHRFNEIRISIDGPQEINDTLRGKGSFQKVMRAIECVIKAGGDPIAFITVTSLNTSHLKHFMGYLLSNGLSKIHVSPLKLAGRVDDEKMLVDIDTINRITDEFWYETFGLRLKSYREEAFNCGVGKFLTVYPDGRVYPCHLLALPEFCIGNVRAKSLYEINTQSELLKKMSALDFRSIPYCVECFNKLSDGEGCLGELYQQVDNVKRELSEILQLGGKVEE